MILKDAIYSGKRFKRKNDPLWLTYKNGKCSDEAGNPCSFSIEDVLVEDWITEQERVEITWDQLMEVFKVGSRSYIMTKKLRRALKEGLGFK